MGKKITILLGNNQRCPSSSSPLSFQGKGPRRRRLHLQWEVFGLWE